MGKKVKGYAGESPWYQGPTQDRAVANELMHYPPKWGDKSTIRWRAVAPFVETMQLPDKLESGRSAKYMYLMASDGRRYPFFVRDLLSLARSGRVQPGGLVTGTWAVVKRGENFGVMLLDDDEKNEEAR